MISVIMPVYNTGEYLKEALDSLINQTFRNFEVICVNDASDDEYTNRLLNEFQQRDNRINVIWLKENVGAGEARNIGFSKAQGEYVIFLDADDIFRADMLELMYNKIIEENADVCFCGFKSFNASKGIKEYSFEILSVLYNEKEDFFIYAIYNPWTKLCRTDFLKENNIYFQSLPCANDVFYSCMVYLKSTKQCKCDECLVEYRIQTNNQISFKRENINFFYAMQLVLSAIENEKNKKKQIILNIIIQGIQFIIIEKYEIKRKKYYNCIKKIILNNKKIKFNAKIYNYYFSYILNNDYDEKWIFNCMDFYFQLQLYKNELIEKIKNYSKIILWGNGKRGEAFQKFCKENKLNLIGIADSKNELVGKRTSYGYSIIHTNMTLGIADIIVACNSDVYNYIQKNSIIPVINLEEYCKIP